MARCLVDTDWAIESLSGRPPHKSVISATSPWPVLAKRAVRRLEYVDIATSLQDLKVPPSNRLHALKADRAGQYSISVNDQWRICFRFVDGDAYDVELTDYH